MSVSRDSKHCSNTSNLSRRIVGTDRAGGVKVSAEAPGKLPLLCLPGASRSPTTRYQTSPERDKTFFGWRVRIHCVAPSLYPISSKLSAKCVDVIEEEVNP